MMSKMLLKANEVNVGVYVWCVCVRVCACNVLLPGLPCLQVLIAYYKPGNKAMYVCVRVNVYGSGMYCYVHSMPSFVWHSCCPSHHLPSLSPSSFSPGNIHEYSAYCLTSLPPIVNPPIFLHPLTSLPSIPSLCFFFFFYKRFMHNIAKGI